MEDFKKGFKFGLGFVLANMFITLITTSIILAILALAGLRIPLFTY